LGYTLLFLKERFGHFYSHVPPYTEVYKAMDLIKSKEALKVILTF